MVEVIYSKRAENDVKLIAHYTILQWGIPALAKYEYLIDLAINLLKENPNHLHTREIKGLPSGYRALKLSSINQKNATLRVKNPAHIIYYRHRNR
ncbi:MAG: type II toxin-antitoxin system RelE/ParE family toxin [Alphaproteobacteria bacterium]|nr:type II toxin-antitoxin system RelE/ParE family toxin [Alphaproteobacteria bacterium]